jgi:hypothetical protein
MHLRSVARNSDHYTTEAVVSRNIKSVSELYRQTLNFDVTCSILYRWGVYY